MSIRKFLAVLSILFSSITCFNALAVTTEDCKNRALNAYDNMSSVGGTDSEKQKLGAYAASECLKEVNSGGSATGNDDKSVLGLIFALVVLGGIGVFVAFALKSMERKTRHIILGTVFGIVSFILLAMWFQSKSKENNSKELRERGIVWENEKISRQEKTSKTVQDSIESIRPLIAGDKNGPLAGKKNMEQVIKENTTNSFAYKFGTFSVYKYKSVTCEINDHTCGLLDKNHPISKGLSFISIIYCNSIYEATKNGTEKSLRQQNADKYIATGIALRYADEDDQTAVVNGLMPILNSKNVHYVVDRVGKNYPNVAYQQGLSIFWTNGKNTVDLCGNTSLKD